MTSKSSTLSRTRQQSSEGAEIIYKGRDLTSILLRHSDSFQDTDQALIIDCYREHGRGFFEKIALDNKIVPFVAHTFISLDCDKVFWEEKHRYFVDKNKRIKQLLESIFVEMELYSCSSLTLTENFGALLSSDACIGCFCSGDVDLSADISEKDEIIRCLNSLQFFSKSQPEEIGEYSGQSMQFFNEGCIEGGFWVNVIWKPVTRAFLIQEKYDLRLSRDRLLASTKDGSSIRVLDDTSLLYFSALHIAAGHYFTLSPGLRLYVDIDRLARSSNIKWDDIVKWEVEDDAGIRISTALYLSYKLLNTPIPEKVYKKIFENKRSKKLLNYLYNAKTNQIQSKSSIYRRLYIELASDNKLLITNFMSRVLQLLFTKF